MKIKWKQLTLQVNFAQILASSEPMLVHSHTYFLMTAASNLDWQETERLNKKTALQSLLTAPEYALVTQPYVLTLLAMV